MKIMRENDVKIFEELVKMEQDQLLKTLFTFLKKNYDNVTATEDYLFAEGDIPIALVAHLDTVFADPPENVYYDPRKGVIWSPEGLGADDRAGIFSILKIVKAGYRPHIIFTTEEERGGIGAAQLIIKNPKCPFKELKYMIELDRAGTCDCVFYDCENDLFTEYIESFGFIEALGSFSDISILAPHWGVAAVNLSIGYENEHSYREVLHVGPLYRTIKRVIAMLKDADNITEPFIYIRSYLSRFGYNWEDYLTSDIALYSKEVIKCASCGKNFYEYETIPVKTPSGGTVFYCPDCIANNDIDWCEICGEAFEVDEYTKEAHICRDCRKMGGH